MTPWITEISSELHGFYTWDQQTTLWWYGLKTMRRDFGYSFYDTKSKTDICDVMSCHWVTSEKFTWLRSCLQQTAVFLRKIPLILLLLLVCETLPVRRSMLSLNKKITSCFSNLAFQNIWPKPWQSSYALRPLGWTSSGGYFNTHQSRIGLCSILGSNTQHFSNINTYSVKY